MRPMFMARRYLLFFTLGFAGLLSAAVLQQQVYDFKVEHTFERDGIRIRGLGACEIGNSTVSCWNMDGNPDPELTQDVKTMAQDSNRYFNFIYGQKNRYLIVSHSAEKGNMSLQSAGSSSTQTTTLQRGNGDQVDLIWTAVPASQSFADVAAYVYQLPGPPPVTLGFKVGAEASFAGTRYTVGPWKSWNPTEPSQRLEAYTNAPVGSQWCVAMGQERGGDSGARLQISTFTPFDKQGKPIHYVDKKGQPVSDVKVLSEMTPSNPMNPGMNPSSGKYPRAVFQQSNVGNAGATLMITNVNPESIGSLQISGWGQLRILIQGFPLDPK